LKEEKSPDLNRGFPLILATLMGLEPTTFAVTERAWKPLEIALRRQQPLL
jgi:hypothetical protein